MLNRNEANIVSATYTLNFKDVDTAVRLQQAAAEKAFGGMVNGQSIQTNVPDAFDPAAPRILFNSTTKQLAISQAACQLTLNFLEGKRLSLGEQWSAIEKNAKQFYIKASEFKPIAYYGISSFIFQIAIPSAASSSELNKWLYHRLIKKSTEELASISVAIGYRRSAWYLNVKASAYEKRELKVSNHNGPRMIQMQIDESPTTGRGINLSIDINNRPKFQLEKASLTDLPDAILKLARDFAIEQMDTIFSAEEVV